jgi:hypothetical protein
MPGTDNHDFKKLKCYKILNQWMDAILLRKEEGTP